MTRWIDSLPLGTVEEVPQHLRLALALRLLAYAYHYEQLHPGDNDYGGIARASALIVVERRRLEDEAWFREHYRQRINDPTRPSLLNAVSSLVSAMVTVNGNQYYWLRNTESHLRKLWKDNYATKKHSLSRNCM